MKIKEVSIKNFYSFKQTTINFEKYSGLVCIEGDNKDSGGSNGAGKSVIIEAITWALFGKTVRKSTEDALVNNQEKTGCEVSIELDGDTVITRGKRPTSLRFIYRGEDRTQNNVLNTQREIESVLGIEYKTFLAAAVFGQQNNVDFLSASLDDKRLIIKNFLNLEHIFGLRGTVKDLKSEYNQGRKAKESVRQSLEDQVEEANEKIDRINEINQEVEESFGEEILKTDVEELVGNKSKAENLSWELKDFERERKKHEQFIGWGKEKSKCPTCKRELDDFNHEEHDKKVEEAKKAVKDLDTLIKKKEDLIAQYKEKTVPDKQLKLIRDYQELASKASYYEESKVELMAKIDECIEDIRQFEQKYEVMRFWEKAFSESGIVRYIIRNVLGYLNTKITYYLSYLTNNQFALKFDEELRETITNNGVEVSHMSLSGGEKKKINLAVMLSLQSLLSLSNNQEGNLVFFDEVATFVDEDGIEGLYILLQELKKSKTLFIITHDYHLKSLLTDTQTIKVVKEKGTSRIV